jgi:hypothetical protein
LARIRSIKPELRTSLTAAGWPRDVRYFFVLLWGYLDDYGRGVDEPRLIKADCFPLDDDVTAAVTEAGLAIIARSGSLCRYQVEGRTYLHAPAWINHQKPSHPTDSRVPACPLHESPAASLEDFANGSGEAPRHFSSSSAHPENGTNHPYVKQTSDAIGSDVRRASNPQDTGRDQHERDSGEAPEEFVPEQLVVVVDVDVDGAVSSKKNSSSTADAADGRRSKRRPREPPEGFDKFWSAYPRKVARAAAAKAWTRAVDAGADAALIIEGACFYAMERKLQDPQFTKHPATWLNGGCWQDEPDPAYTPPPVAAPLRPATYDQRAAQTDAAVASLKARLNSTPTPAAIAATDYGETFRRTES